MRGLLAALVMLGSTAACVGNIEGEVILAPADAALARPPADAAPVAELADANAAAGNPCPRVAHIGDSLTAYTIAPLTQAYQAVGSAVQIDAYGGRAVLQKVPADPKTGRQAALDIRASGFDGCWVVALGTNDTADVAAGASYTRAHDIDEMMTAIDPAGAARVLWVNTYTTLSTGYYANDNMQRENQALEDARGRWANLRVFDWAAIAASGSAPFVDGIHHTAAGYAVRNAAIAAALAMLAR